MVEEGSGANLVGRAFEAWGGCCWPVIDLGLPAEPWLGLAGDGAEVSHGDFVFVVFMEFAGLGGELLFKRSRAWGYQL